jgi:dephospho-CoA kinase
LERQAGLPLLDADLYARQALAPGSAAAAAVLERYGQGLLSSSPGAAGIDRAALGRIVFHDIDERRWLEQLIHPLVRQRFDAELARLRQAPLVVLMIPLLFETGLEALCSEVWLVDCEPEQQLARLMARDGCSEADAKARIQAQWPIERKRPLADLLIDNRSDLQALESQLRQALATSGSAAIEPSEGICAENVSLAGLDYLFQVGPWTQSKPTIKGLERKAITMGFPIGRQRPKVADAGVMICAPAPAVACSIGQQWPAFDTTAQPIHRRGYVKEEPMQPGASRGVGVFHEQA